MAQLLDRNALAYIKAEKGPLFRKWVQLLPQELVKSHPWLCSKPSKALDYRYYAIIATSRCGVLVIRGRLKEAIDHYQQAIEHMIADGADQFNLSGNVYQDLGMLLYQRNDLDEAEKCILEGLALSRSWGNLNAICGGLIDDAYVKIGQGDLGGAKTIIDEAGSMIKSFSPYIEVSKMFLECKVHYALAKDDIDEAVRLVKENGLKSDNELSFLDEHDHIVLARVLIYQGS